MSDAQRRIDRLRVAWAKLYPSPGAPCRHESGSSEYVRLSGSGARLLYLGCKECQAPLEPGTWIKQNGRNLSDVPVGEDRRVENPPCEVCGAWGTEVHHWAPKEFFGVSEAQHWPTSYLCPECHGEWHTKIGHVNALPL